MIICFFVFNVFLLSKFHRSYRSRWPRGTSRWHLNAAPESAAGGGSGGFRHAAGGARGRGIEQNGDEW